MTTYVILDIRAVVDPVIRHSHCSLHAAHSNTIEHIIQERRSQKRSKPHAKAAMKAAFKTETEALCTSIIEKQCSKATLRTHARHCIEHCSKHRPNTVKVAHRHTHHLNSCRQELPSRQGTHPLGTRPQGGTPGSAGGMCWTTPSSCPSTSLRSLASLPLLVRLHESDLETHSLLSSWCCTFWTLVLQSNALLSMRSMLQFTRTAPHRSSLCAAVKMLAMS